MFELTVASWLLVLHGGVAAGISQQRFDALLLVFNGIAAV